MRLLRRRWKRAVVLVFVLAVILFAGGYLYLVYETGSPPPPLSLDDDVVAAGSSPDGVWQCASRGRIRIVGRWMEDATLHTGNTLVHVPPPVDLTELARGRELRVEVGDSLVLMVLWRRNTLRITGRAGSRSIRSTCHRTA
jgi:hypothetical protein